MKKIYFTVGPSQLYSTVNTHIQTALDHDIPSLSHRSNQFMDLYKHTTDSLKKLLNIPPSHHVFFTSSALEAMERVIANTVYEKSLHFVNGSFSRAFYETAVDLKKEAVRIDVPNGEGFDFNSIAIPEDTELFSIVQNETSTGASIPLQSIYALKKENPSVLVAIDVVSSIPYVNIDFSYIDIAFFSVQKGFGLPAGLGVLIVNEKSLSKADWIVSKGSSIGGYHNFQRLLEFDQKFQTRETPNVLNIYLLDKITNDMLQAGITNIRKDTKTKADLLYNFFDNHKRYNPYVQHPFRSETTIVIDVNGNSESIVNTLLEKGFVISKGYGKRKDRHIRIGNFPAHSIDDVKSLIKQFPDA